MFSFFSYLEAIDVLYATDIIHINSVPLMINIHSLILPQRLASITSLELIWDLDIFNLYDQKTEQVVGLAAYHALIETVASGTFPG